MSGSLQALMDRAEIADLLATMTRLINDQQIETYLDCYVKDGTFELIGMPPFNGPEAIGGMMRSTPGVIHMTMDVVITLDGAKATAHSNLMSAWARLDKSANGFLYSGRYHDDLVRTPDGWKMRHRRISLDLDPARVFEIVQQEAGTIDRNAWIAAAKSRWSG